MAVEKQDLEIVKLLLKKPQINISFISKSVKLNKDYERVIENKTALMLADELQNEKISELIIGKMNDLVDPSYFKSLLS